jgi:ABC-type bacteriocin/lantibiotic exporter with double-glycine peptidase domain
MNNRTTFMIAHRLRTLANCNLLLMLDRGRLRLCTSDLSEILADPIAAAQPGPRSEQVI